MRYMSVVVTSVAGGTHSGESIRVPEVGAVPATAGAPRTVVVVWAAHGGSGASVLSLALADAADRQALPVGLIDLCEPALSGLAAICTIEGRTLRMGSTVAEIRLGKRERIGVRRLAPATRDRAEGRSLPSPDDWLATLEGQAEVVIVDAGCVLSAPSRDGFDDLNDWLSLGTPCSSVAPRFPRSSSAKARSPCSSSTAGRDESTS